MRNARVSQGNSERFISRIILTCNRNLVSFCYLHGFVAWICLNLNWLLGVTGVMHEADDAYSIRSTWSCYWLDQFLTLALITLILSIFYISLDLSAIYFAHFSGCWASFVCNCHSIPECCVMFSGVKLSIRSFVLFICRSLFRWEIQLINVYGLSEVKFSAFSSEISRGLTCQYWILSTPSNAFYDNWSKVQGRLLRNFAYIW